MTGNQHTIRRATQADVAALAELGAVTFTLTFGHLYVESDLQAFLASSHAAETYAATLADPDCAIWLAERAGQAIGYAQAGPCRLPHPQVDAADGELKRLYLLPQAQNAGIGSGLFDQAEHWLERAGPRPLWVSVWSDNIGAQRFYTRRGFRHAGEYAFQVGAQRDREFIFKRPARNGVAQHNRA